MAAVTSRRQFLAQAFAAVTLVLFPAAPRKKRRLMPSESLMPSMSLYPRG